MADLAASVDFYTNTLGFTFNPKEVGKVLELDLSLWGYKSVLTKIQ